MDIFARRVLQELTFHKRRTKTLKWVHMALQLTLIYCFSFSVNLNLDFYNKTKQFDYMMDRKHFLSKEAAEERIGSNSANNKPLEVPNSR